LSGKIANLRLLSPSYDFGSSTYRARYFFEKFFRQDQFFSTKNPEILPFGNLKLLKNF